MNLIKMEIRNFLGIGEATITFDKHGLTLIEGLNHDSPTASSNGAGKSSIFEALYWVLYGKTKRGLTGDDVINEKAVQGCEVKLWFDDYIVYRYRKEPTLGTGLKLWKHNSSGLWDELTKGTIKDTQQLLEDIIKISDLTFGKIAYFGQGDIKAFASMSDAELKQVFEQALGLSSFTKYLDNAKKYKSEIEVNMAGSTREIEELTKEAGFIQEKIDLIKTQIAELIENRKQEVLRLRTEVKNVEGEIAEKYAAIKSIEDEDYIEKLAALRDREAKLKDLLKLKDQLATKYLEESSNLIRLKANQEMKKREIAKRLKELENINSKVGTSCGECGKEITLSDLEVHMEQIKDKIRAISKDVKDCAGDVLKADEEVQKLARLTKPLEDKIEAMRGVEYEREKILEEQKRKDELHKRANILEEKKAEVEAMIDALKAEMESPEDKMSPEVNRLAANELKRMELLAQLKGLQEELEGACMLVEIVGNGGLKSYIFDSVTPELNRLIAEYMNVLNPDISVEISTVSKLKSGDFKEKFCVKVGNTNGSSKYDGSSGGERQLINLAIALGFNSICRAIAGGSINTLFLDEPLENLDESSAERAMELCEKFIAKVPNVFLISHNPAIRDLVSNRITIEKRGGKAKLAA